MLKYMFLILLVGCGSSGDPDNRDRIISVSIKDVEIDEELKQSVKEFIGDLALHGKDFKVTIKSIKFVDNFEGNVVGRCYYNDRVEILKGMEYNETYLKLLMYHELGHCILKLGHTKEGSNSIMQPTLIGDSDYIKTNWSGLVSNLINSSPNLNLTKVFDDFADK